MSFSQLLRCISGRNSEHGGYQRKYQFYRSSDGGTCTSTVVSQMVIGIIVGNVVPKIILQILAVLLEVPFDSDHLMVTQVPVVPLGVCITTLCSTSAGIRRYYEVFVYRKSVDSKSKLVAFPLL